MNKWNNLRVSRIPQKIAVLYSPLINIKKVSSSSFELVKWKRIWMSDVWGIADGLNLSAAMRRNEIKICVHTCDGSFYKRN